MVAKIVTEGIRSCGGAGGMMKWLKQLFSRKHLYDKLDEEVSFHLRKRIEELVATMEEATTSARRKFGNLASIKQMAREAWGWKWLEDLMVDLRYGIRMLRKNPVLTITGVLTLALGIGANTAIFTLLYGLVLRSLPTPTADQLVRVGIASTAESDPDDGSWMTYQMLNSFRSEQSSFRDLSGWVQDYALLRDKQGSVQRYTAAMVSGNAFDLLGLQPYKGRLILPSDDVSGGPSTGWVVVLSYGFWKNSYGGAEDVVGRKIMVSDVPMTVIGIAPSDFQGIWPGTQVNMYLPLHFLPVAWNVPDLMEETNKKFFDVDVIGRLKPGVSMAHANAEVHQLQEGLLRRFIPLRFQKDPYFQKAYLKVSSARSGMPNYITYTYKKPLYLMQGLVGIVLLLCCVNIGGIMLSRVVARHHEFAVRTAVGASAKRLVLQYLTESFVVAMLGSTLGAMIAWYGSDALLRFFRDPMMGEAVSVRPDTSIFWVTLSFAVLTTLLCGTFPAWKASRTDPGTLLLKSRSTIGGPKQIVGRMFVPIQVALSLVLVVIASLLSLSIVKLRTEQTGFDLDHVTIQNSPLAILKLKGDPKLDLYQRMVDRLMEMPGIDSAAVTFQTPMTGVRMTADFQAVSGVPRPPEDTQIPFNEVGPGYFRTMKTRILAGREFDKTDRSLNVCVLNESAAEFFFPQEQALGRYLRNRVTDEFPDQVECQVIGLAEDAKYYDVRQRPPRTIYLPLSTKRVDNLLAMVFLIHSPTKAQAVAGFRQTLSEITPTVPLVIFVTLREQMDAALGSQELITLLANFFGIVALLLSALGLYGLLSASVTQRRGEIGVRLALGASPSNVLRMILSEALVLLSWGMLLGALGLFFATRFVESMLHGVSAYDPMTLAAVAVTLLLVTILAAIVPALRAARLDPIETLRSE
jgi:predicted permease